jgi:hypothetical protein
LLGFTSSWAYSLGNLLFKNVAFLKKNGLFKKPAKKEHLNTLIIGISLSNIKNSY